MISQVIKSYSCDYYKVPPLKRITEFLKKPVLDSQLYKVIKLKNRLKALFIYNPYTERVSGTLNINIGSFSDLVDILGIAYTVKHLLFMGIKKVNSGRPIRNAIVLNIKVFSLFIKSSLYTLLNFNCVTYII
jgi:predicted Zn-dependent peptidase